MSDNITIVDNSPEVITVAQGPRGPQGPSGVATFGMSNIGNTSGISGVVSGSGMQVLFAGGSNVTLEQSINGQSATVSVNAGGGGGGGALSVSAGGSSASLGSLVFSNSNGVSFGLSGSTITGSHNGLTNAALFRATSDNSQLQFTSANSNFLGTGATASLRFTSADSQLQFTSANSIFRHTSQNSQLQFTSANATNSIGVSTFGNTAGTTGPAVGSRVDMVFVGGANITLSQSLNIGGDQATISFVGPQLSVYQLTADNSLSLGTGATQSFRHTSADSQLQFTSANSKFVQEWQITGNTAGTGSSVQGSRLYFSGGNNITLSGSSNSIVISGPNTAAQTAESQSFGISNLGNTSGTSGIASGAQGRFLIAGGNNITLSQSVNGASATVTISGPNTAAQTVESQTLGISNLGNTSGTSGVISGGQIRYLFAGGNNVTLSQSTNGASATVTISAFNQSVQPIGTNTIGMSNIGNTAGDTAIRSGTGMQVVFAGGNNITLSQSTNGSNATITVSGPNTVAQTNQTMGYYATGNTTQSTQGTQDARSVTFQGAGNVSVGVSGGSVVISGGSAAASPVNFSAGTTSNNLGSVVFSNSNLVSFGLNGSTITGSVPGTSSLSATGNASISVNGSTISIGDNAPLLNFSGGNSSGNTFLASTGNTVAFYGGSNITLSLDSANQKVSISAPSPATISMWPCILPGSTAVSTYYSGSTSQGAAGNSTQSGYTFSLYAVPLPLPAAVAFSDLRIGVSNNTAAGTGSVTHLWSAGFYTNNLSTLGLVKAYYGGIFLSQNSQTSQTFSVFTVSTGGATAGGNGGFAGLAASSVYSRAVANMSSDSQMFGRMQFAKIDSGVATTFPAGQYYFVFGNCTVSSGANVYSNVGYLQSNAISASAIPDLGRENSTQTSNYLPAWGAISTTFTSVSNQASWFAMPANINIANMSLSNSAWHRFHLPIMRNHS